MTAAGKEKEVSRIELNTADSLFLRSPAKITSL